MLIPAHNLHEHYIFLFPVNDKIPIFDVMQFLLINTELFSFTSQETKWS